MKKTFVYAGNWTVQTEEGQGGIGIYEYLEENGRLKFLELIRPDITPGMMQIDAKSGVLYLVDEQKNNPSFAMQGGGGRVVAFSIDPETGGLAQLGAEQPSFGTLPTYCALARNGKWLIAVNHWDKQAITKVCRGADGAFRVATDFSDVTAALYPLSEDGSILPASDVIKFDPDRRELPARIACLHAVYFTPDGSHFLITNMKQDQVLMMRIDETAGKMEIASTLSCPRGSWPRYGAFHPTKRLFYMNNERSLTVNTLRYDEKGKLELIQTLDAAPQLPCVQPGKRISQSDIRISADGKYVYDFYRYTDAAVVYEVEEDSGLLRMAQSLELEEKRPRGFAISPDGRFLLTANLTGAITTLAVDGHGRLAETGFVERGMQYPGNVIFYQPENEKQ